MDSQALVGASLTENIGISPVQGVQILLAAVAMGVVIRKLYIRYALTYSSPVGFGNTLLLVLVCVSGLIAIVKSTLALSLGWVGALSVVRFRTAVKEPFTLSFILLSVCLGIANGAEQYVFAFLILTCGCTITIMLFHKKTSSRTNAKDSFGISADTLSISGTSLESVLKALKILDEFSNSYTLKTLTTSSVSSDGIIQVNLDSPERFDTLARRLREEADIETISYFRSPS